MPRSAARGSLQLLDVHGAAVDVLRETAAIQDVPYRETRDEELDLVFRHADGTFSDVHVHVGYALAVAGGEAVLRLDAFTVRPLADGAVAYAPTSATTRGRLDHALQLELALPAGLSTARDAAELEAVRVICR